MRTQAERTIGFFLQMEDHMTPVLRDAGNAYTRFVTAIEKNNKAAYKAASSGMSKISEMAKSLESLPHNAEKAYTATMAKLRQLARVATSHKLNLEIDAGSSNTLRKLIQRAVMDGIQRGFRKVKLGLTAAIPKRRQQGFSQDGNLRAAYRHVVNPVDYQGNMTVPKFASGKSPAGSTGGKVVDDLYAFISSKEWVLSSDQIGKAMEKAAGASFAGADKAQDAGIKDASMTMLNLKKTLSEMMAELNDGKPVYADIQALLKDIETATASCATNMAGWTKSGHTFAPMVAEFQEQLESAAADSKKMCGEWLKYGKIVHPIAEDINATAKATRFMALRTALGDITRLFSDMHTTARDVFGGDQMKDFITSMNHANRVLDIHRDELGAVKKAVAEAAANSGGTANLSEMADAFNGLAQAGMRGAAKITDFAVNVVQVAKITGRSADSVADDLTTMNRAFGMSKEQGTATLLTLRDIANKTGTSFDALADSAKRHAKNSGAWMRTLGAEGAKSATESLAKVQAALNKTAEGMGDEMSEIMSRAAGGDTEALKQISMITNGAVGSAEQLRNALKAGGPALESIVSSMGAALDPNMTAESVAAISGSMGISADYLQAMATSREANVAALQEIAGLSTKTAEANAKAKESTKNVQTWWETFHNKLTSGLGALGTGFIDFFHEFNLQSLSSMVYLTKELGGTALNFIKNNGAKIASQAMSLGSSIASSLGKPLASVVTQAASSISGPLVSAIGGAARGSAGLLVSLGSFLTTLPIVGGAFTFFGGLLTTVFTTVGAAIMATPIGWIAAAILAVVAIVIIFRKEFAAVFEGIWIGLKQTLMPAWDNFVGILSKTWDHIKKAFQPIIDMFSSGSGNGSGLMDSLVSFGKLIGTVMGYAIEFGFIPLQIAIQAIGYAIAILGDIFSGIFGFIKNIISAIILLFTGDFSGALSAVGDAFKAIGTMIMNIFKEVWGYISGVVDLIGGAVSSVMSIFRSSDKKKPEAAVPAAIAPAASPAGSPVQLRPSEYGAPAITASQISAATAPSAPAVHVAVADESAEKIDKTNALLGQIAGSMANRPLNPGAPSQNTMFPGAGAPSQATDKLASFA